MTNEDLKKVIDFYNNVILQQIIKPIEITEIYKLVCPTCDTYIHYRFKQRAIAVYVQNLKKERLEEMENYFKSVDKTDTAAPVEITEQSHQEDFSLNCDNQEVNEIDEKLMAEQFISDVKESGILNNENNTKPKRTRKPRTNKKKTE